MFKSESTQWVISISQCKDWRQFYIKYKYRLKADLIVIFGVYLQHLCKFCFGGNRQCILNYIGHSINSHDLSARDNVSWLFFASTFCSTLFSVLNTCSTCSWVLISSSFLIPVLPSPAFHLNPILFRFSQLLPGICILLFLYPTDSISQIPIP